MVAVLRKRLSGFFLIFFVYPKHISSSISNQQIHGQANIEYYKSIIRSSHDSIEEQHEPGFDITDEEMKKFKLWDKGIIPYYIDTISFTDKVLRDRIRSFLNTVNGVTPLSFVELPRPPKNWSVTRWVFFVNRIGQLGCGDHSIKNLTNEGVQRVVLGYDCMSTGEELPEAVLAIAGVPPQHNAPNRDDYIEVLEENIFPAKKYLYEKLKDNEWLFHDVPYDFASAGHFEQHRYSINGRATIETKASFKRNKIGQQHSLSKIDISKIKMLYNYISEKTKNKVPGCNKLFRRGRKFKYEGLKIRPRPKPNRYLDESLKNDYNKSSDESEINSSNFNSMENLKDHGENSSKENENDSGKSNVKTNANNDDERNSNAFGIAFTDSEQINDKQNSKGTKENLQTRLHQYLKKGIFGNIKQKVRIRDPLLYLSDYQTGEDIRQRTFNLKSYKNFDDVDYKSVKKS